MWLMIDILHLRICRRYTGETGRNGNDGTQDHFRWQPVTEWNKNQSVQLIVTSPLYCQIKDYGAEDQIGFHDSYDTYIILAAQNTRRIDKRTLSPARNPFSFAYAIHAA